MAQLFTPPFQTTLDANAAPVPGALLYFYESGTLVPAPVYEDAALTTPHTQPVVSDAAGRFAAIYLDRARLYRVRVTDEVGTIIRDIDPIGDNLAADLADGGGSSLIGFTQAGTGAVERTALAKMRETVSITDFGASTGSSDNTAAINAAISAVFTAGGGTVEVPLGRFNHAGVIVQKEGVAISGKGYGSRLHSTNTTRLHGIEAIGPEGGRIAGLSVSNIRLTSGFAITYDVDGFTPTSNNGVITGNAIRWLRVGQSFISNVWTHNWSDSGVSLTDCDRVHASTVDIDTVTQGYDIFNDSLCCTFDGLTIRNTFKYVGLNIEGHAGGSTDDPRDCGGSNVFVQNAGTYGINFVQAIRPFISNWVVTGTRGNDEGDGSGFEAYGSPGTRIGVGQSFDNAGYGLKIGPTENDASISGVTTSSNALGSCLVTDGGGVGPSYRVSLSSSCKFIEGAPSLSGNASIVNDVAGQQTIRGTLPRLLEISTQSIANRNAQIVFGTALDADVIRIGPDIATNSGAKNWQVYLDSYVAPMLSASVAELTGAGDNVQTLGAASKRFSVVYAGTATINTSDERDKQQIGSIPDEWLDAWGGVQWRRFKFNDAVAEKGEDARWHAGLIAQAIETAFGEHGLDATEIGLLCFDAWDGQAPRDAETDPEGNVTVPAFLGRAAGDRWGVRMSECLAIEAAWQRREIARMAARLDALEGLA